MKDIDDSRPLALAGSLEGPRLWLTALVCVPAAVIFVVCIVIALHAPADMKPVFLAALIVAPLSGLLAFAFVLRLVRRIGVRVNERELIVDTGLGRKVFALSDLRAQGLRVVDLDRDREVQPFLRVMGTSLPGLRSGRFILRNREKGICILLDRSKVAVLRSAEQRLTLLLSLARPDDLRAALERAR